MSFRFLVNDLSNNKTVTVRILADREKTARQKLEKAGYRPIAMVGVETVKRTQPQGKIELQLRHPTPQVRLSHTPSRAFRLRAKLGSLIADYLAPFNLLD
jgi:hypothetical protein